MGSASDCKFKNLLAVMSKSIFGVGMLKGSLAEEVSIPYPFPNLAFQFKQVYSAPISLQNLRKNVFLGLLICVFRSRRT
jgi:hypothetical protein